MPDFDLLIRGGTIIDGTRVPRFVGDIGIRNGRIARIDASLGRATAAREIRAEGRIVAPGVVDLHTHYDAQVHWDPCCTNSGWHGTTTVAVGNCGFGFAPVKPTDRERTMRMMENTEQIPYSVMGKALPWSWESFPDWLGHLRALPKGINIASFVPLNPLMIYVMGVDAAKSRPATRTERGRMQDLLHEAMDAGALGFAFSHQGQKNGHTDFDGTPMPTDIMDPEEAYVLGDVLRERGQGLIQVLADMPGCALNRGIIEELAVRSKRPILHNILQVIGEMPEYHEGILAWLDDMEAEGHAVYSHAMSMHTWTEFNFMDYNFWDGAGEIYKSFSNAGSPEAKLALARDPAFVAKFRELYDPVALMGVAGGSIESFRLVGANGSAGFAGQEGQLLGDLAARRGQHVIDLLFELISSSNGAAEVRTTLLGVEDPAVLADVLRHPRVLFGSSDGGAHVKYWSGGQFSTDVITWLARDNRLFSLEDVHFNLSYLPARIAGFAHRGALLEGHAADILIYDLDELGCRLDRYDVDHGLPDGSYRRVVHARGIDAVIVNGEPIFEANVATGKLPGLVLPDDQARGIGADMKSAA